MSRRRLVLVTLVMGLVMPASAVAAPGVGHRVEHLDVPGAAPGELRKVDVHLWYPADPATRAQPKTVYTSALHGEPLPNGWAPLSWTVEAETRARGRGARPGRRAVRADRVLARRDQRPDRLRAHAGGDRGRRVHRRSRPRTPTTRRTTCGATTSTPLAGTRRVLVRGRVAGPALPTLNAERVPRPRTARRAASRTAWPTASATSGGARRGCPAGSAAASTRSGGRDGSFARDRHRARRRRRQRPWRHRSHVRAPRQTACAGGAPSRG